ncbi:MAG: hypothetical protein K0Q70_1372, partial [Rhodospirillales bacterium]|nr:hypothetical protein [Rhodospirillales bacterium]
MGGFASLAFVDGTASNRDVLQIATGESAEVA